MAQSTDSYRHLVIHEQYFPYSWSGYQIYIHLNPYVRVLSLRDRIETPEE